MRAASGPQYQGNNGNVATDGNPYYPHNQPQFWVGEFGERSAAVIADVIENAFSNLSVQQADLSAPLAALVDAVSGHINLTLAAVGAATAGLQRRTNLLWWKEALYSPASRISYRQLTPPAAAALMAYDLSR